MSNAEELEQLKAEAKALGIKVHHKAGAKKIQGLINQALAAKAAVPAVPEEETAAPEVDMSSIPRPMTEEQFREGQMSRKRQEANRLVRVRVQCMNPNKKNWTGEIISVGSAKMGTFKKFVPFNSEEPYHVPSIIYQEMKSRKCRVGTSSKGPNNQVIHRNKLIPEFSIEVLSPLTPQELKALAQRQAMVAGNTTDLEQGVSL